MKMKSVRHIKSSFGRTHREAQKGRLLRTHCYTTLIVPSEDGKVYHIRKPGRPEIQQRKLYELFGVTISNLLKTTVKFRKTASN